jgi:predicted DNA-binding antitoxin AbrB/MazE fold protein
MAAIGAEQRPMTNHVDAVYENGVLRPLETLPLEEHQRVRVTISSISSDSLASLVDQSFLEQARKEVAAAAYIPTHEERWQRWDRASQRRTFGTRRPDGQTMVRRAVDHAGLNRRLQGRCE